MSAMAVSSGESRQKELFGSIRSATGEVMELMDDIVWSVNPENDNMQSMIARFRKFAGETLEPANISFNLDIRIPADGPGLPVESRKDFYLIYKEAVNNCAKYSKATYVDIAIYMVGKKLFLKITDNGCGFNYEKAGNGNGLGNMHARADHINGELEITSNEGKGTTIVLNIPFIP
jgi:signal transduction histidine kinase